MRAVLRKIGIAAATAIAIAGSTMAIPGLAQAAGHGGHAGWSGGHGGHGGWSGGHGGHWGGGHWGGGGYWGGGRWGGGYWGWPGAGWGYGGYYGAYASDYAYGGECYIQRHWVINRYGHRVLRRVHICY
jgi:hypothetical protein